MAIKWLRVVIFYLDDVCYDYMSQQHWVPKLPLVNWTELARVHVEVQCQYHTIRYLQGRWKNDVAECSLLL